MKLKELLPLLRNEPLDLIKTNWKGFRTVTEFVVPEQVFSEKELEMEVASISVTEIYLKEP